MWQKMLVFLSGLGITIKLPGVDIHLRQPELSRALQTNEWVMACGGDVPANARPGGSEKDGTALYIARAKIEGGMHIGKVRADFKGAYIPWGGKERKVPYYEVYVGPQKWVPGKGGNIPIGAIVAGMEADGEPLYVVRAEVEAGIHIGKVKRGSKGALIPYGENEISKEEYEVLVV
jgi:hypothetical protein